MDVSKSQEENRYILREGIKIIGNPAGIIDKGKNIFLGGEEGGEDEEEPTSLPNKVRHGAGAMLFLQVKKGGNNYFQPNEKGAKSFSPTKNFQTPRGGVRQKFAEGMLIWWVPKRPICKFFPWSYKFFP